MGTFVIVLGVYGFLFISEGVVSYLTGGLVTTVGWKQVSSRLFHNSLNSKFIGGDINLAGDSFPPYSPQHQCTKQVKLKHVLQKSIHISNSNTCSQSVGVFPGQYHSVHTGGDEVIYVSPAPRRAAACLISLCSLWDLLHNQGPRKTHEKRYVDHLRRVCTVRVGYLVLNSRLVTKA